MDATRHRRILHVDMDAFYASVEQRDHPEWRGRPVVVGADPKGGRGRGVVSAASYEARRFGIHSAQPIMQAYRACPQAIFAPPRFDAYVRESRLVMEELGRFSPTIEPISIDEAFLDCTGTDELFGSDSQLAEAVRRAVRERTDLTCSVGVAPNKYVAKVASDLNKPDGVAICPPGGEQQFLAPLPLRALWGAGPKTAERLAALGCHCVGDVAALPAGVLEKHFGKHGRQLRQLAFGRDERPVVAGHGRKSISEERTFGEDTDDPATLRRTLLAISDHLARRMRTEGVRGRTLQFKIRLAGFETHTRSRTLPQATRERTLLYEFAVQELEAFDRRGKKIRLLGIGVSNLAAPTEAEQLSLWTAKGTEADEVLDELKNRFGKKLSRASLLGLTERPGPGDEGEP